MLFNLSSDYHYWYHILLSWWHYDIADDTYMISVVIVARWRYLKFVLICTFCGLFNCHMNFGNHYHILKTLPVLWWRTCWCAIVILICWHWSGTLLLFEYECLRKLLVFLAVNFLSLRQMTLSDIRYIHWRMSLLSYFCLLWHWNNVY